ncbi:MAG: ABC transporter ATP-binding protein [Gemmataceae bacterium]
MGSTAFARALRFLNYTSLAKWTALAASCVSSLLYVALLALLPLFADLLIYQGEIPTFHRLPPREQDAFLRRHEPSSDLEARKTQIAGYDEQLKNIGIDDAALHSLIARSEEGLGNRERDQRRSILWLAEIPQLTEQAVGAAHADAIRAEIRNQVKIYGLDIASHQNLQGHGILGTILRVGNTGHGFLGRLFARVFPWSYRSGNTCYMIGLIVTALILGLLRSMMRYLSLTSAAHSVLDAVTRLRRAIYNHTYRLGTLAFRALGPTEAVGVSTRHLEAVHDGMFVWLTQSFREPVKAVALVLFALVLNFWFSLAFAGFAFLVWFAGGQIAAAIRRRNRRAEERGAEQLALLQESLMLMRLVKVYLMEAFNLKRVEKQLAGYANARRRVYYGDALYRPLFALLGFVAALILAFLAGVVILHGEMGVVTGITLVAAMASLFRPIVQWIEMRRVLRRSRDSATQMFAFLDRPGSVGQAVEAEFLEPMTKGLEFDNVTLKEPGTGRKLLNGVTFTLPTGKIIGIVGPDDTEKHALVYLIPRFLDPQAGEIRIDRKNIRWATLDSLRAQIAMVLQHNLVFNDTVANNIACGDPAYNGAAIMEAAKTAHAHQFIQKLPQGYETPIGELGHTLTTGEKFRIALARAILRDPSLLIIEEPQTLLSDDDKAMIDDSLQRMATGRTVLYLPHRITTIKSCDRVLLLSHGVIRAAGEHRDLLANNDFYRHLHYLEFNDFAGLTTAPMPETPVRSVREAPF